MKPALLSLFAAGAFACATAGARFPQPVATAFARDEMRRLRTPEADVYYPESLAPAAMRLAGRLTDCLRQLRFHPRVADRGRGVIFLTSANFNNAYVTGGFAGEPLHALVPAQTTLEMFNWFHLGSASASEVGCHEMVHLVQFQQTSGLWAGLNLVLGDVLTPQAFTDRWFLEGLAQYHEGRLGRRSGRPHSPLYRALFESGVASRGGWLEPGDLTTGDRELIPFSGAYLVGLYFVEFLAERYGEEKLWELVQTQGAALLPPLAVTLRFKSVYGLSIGALLDQFEAHLVASGGGVVRNRPPEQRVLVDDVGYIARLAGSAADGAMAVLSAGRDDVVRLAVHERDGGVRFSVPLATFIPPRRWIGAHPMQTSGMSFTADGRWLFLVNADSTSTGDVTAQLWKVDATDGDVVQIWNHLGGLGGAVSPAGDRYVRVTVSADVSRLEELDLATGASRVLHTFEPGTTVAAPAFDPRGERLALAVSAAAGEAFELFLRLPTGELRRLTAPGANGYAPRWIDERRLLHAVEADGLLRARVLDVDTGAASEPSTVPYAALDPAPIGGEDFAFLNRDGWGWSLDAAPLPVVPPPSVEPAPAPAAEPATGGSGMATTDPMVISDRAYSALDHLFVPKLRVPLVLVIPRPDVTGTRIESWDQLYALSLSGTDRLGFHAWALNGLLQLPQREGNVSVEYVNHQLAPWLVRAGGGWARAAMQTDLSASAAVSRAFWGTPVGLSFAGLDRRVTTEEGTARSRLLGPGLGIDYLAAEGTPYGGFRRALGLAAGARWFPRALGSTYDLADLSAELTLAVPLPLLARHSLLLSARGRTLRGAPDRLLQVGGLSSGLLLATRNHRAGAPAPDVLLPAISFTESLRGYEDQGVHATRAAVFHGRYRYPFILDRGWASTLWLLPNLFLRQVDLEGFGSTALTDVDTLRAAGGQVAFRAQLGQVPLSVGYQISARFDRRLPPLHLVSLSFE